jgi:hypothetical protein
MMLQFEFRVVVVGCVMCLMSFRPVEAQDGFADELEIPEGIEISDPVPFSSLKTPKAEDAFRASILEALSREASDDATVTAELPELSSCFQDKRGLLERYLAASPAWRVFEVRGARYATRRWKMAGGWRYEMHGYYSDFDVNWGERNRLDLPDFQTRCTLGLSGRPWVTFKRDVTEFATGIPTEVQLTERFDKQNSLTIITAGNLLVEVFEQTQRKERSLTKTTLKIIEAEAARIAGVKDWSALVRLLPPGSICHGKPEFQLCQPGEPGVFDSVAWVNPGEAGTTYLKAFEITQGTPLSVTNLMRYANERLGWSADPNELFFFNTHFLITEGDWGKPYGARFEVWFKPDSGEPERKLLERTFKIEGWMR